MHEEIYIQGFIKRAQDRGLTPEQTQGLLKQAGLLGKLGLMGLGGAGLYGGLKLHEAIEDTQRTEHQRALEDLLEHSKALPSDEADSYIARYLKDLMKRRHSEAQDIYNL
jgi:hypothetical protein